MKAIDAASIPELKWMPWIVCLLIVAGLIVAWRGSYKTIFAWVVAYGVAAVAGLVDFYRWGYDYGHNLDPNAIIKIPGMTYQPPLIGTKQLLNFTAHSWPATGGIAAGVAMVIALVALILAARGRRSIGVIAAAGVLATACAPRANELVFTTDGKTACEYCGMAITDARTGGVVLTARGKKYQFDSVDCLASFAAANHLPAGQIWVVDFENPGHLLRVSDAEFVAPPAGLSTGMGGSLIAVVSHRGASAKTWSQVVASASGRAEPHEHALVGQP
jgi:copper chaperone NosL